MQEAKKALMEEEISPGLPLEEEKPKFIIEEKVAPKPKRKMSFESKVSSIGEDEDEELEIPAFIRRKMKK